MRDMQLRRIAPPLLAAALALAPVTSAAQSAPPAQPAPPQAGAPPPTNPADAPPPTHPPAAGSDAPAPPEPPPPGEAPPPVAPPVDAPPVDAPPVDAPPVDAPPVDAPPPVIEAPPEPPPPPATGKSGLRGRVTDAKTGEGLIEATVKVVKGGKGQVVTDVDGNYELELPPGEYELRVYYELYQGRKITGVTVSKGKLETLDIGLEADAGAVQEVVVEEKADPKSEGAQLTLRKKAAVVQDTVSSQEISRTPDSNAGDAVKRVVSATVVGGKYVFVRGLGGRYALTLLNGVVLPSPDPDNPSVPLDLFPASLLANLSVVKSYMADLPGTFSGGALLIETNAYPEKLEVKLKVGGSFDSVSTGKSDMLTYRGGSVDWLGFDSGRRDLPGAVPRDRPVDSLSPADNSAAGAAFSNIWEIDQRTATPNLSVQAQVGGTTNVGERGKRLGYLSTVTYGQKLSMRSSAVARAAIDSGNIVATDEAEIQEGLESVTWGGLGNVGLELDKNHQVGAFVLWSRAAEDRAIRDEGYSSGDGSDYRKTRLTYQVRQLSFFQLSGRHKFKLAQGAELRWQGNFALTSRDEPDTRDLFYLAQPDGTYLLLAQPLSAERFFSSLEDSSGGVGADGTIAWGSVSVKSGVALQATSRRFDARRLGYAFIGSDYGVLSLPDPEMTLAGSRFGSDWKLVERTQGDDSYSADRTVIAGYAYADWKLDDQWRVIGGARLESADQTLDTGSPLVNMDFEPIDRYDLDVLPGVSAVFAPTERMNVRASGSLTLARPQFRELAPFLYYDFSRRRSVTGNAKLKNTSIANADLRWEWFPGSRDVVAASLFYKRFDRPIELVIKNPSGDSRYENTTSADVVGLELEARGSFGRFTKPLAPLRGAANLTIIDSTVDLTGAVGSFTNTTRQLQGQSPYIVNLDLGWTDEKRGFEISLLYNVAGRRLAEVGTSELPDIYELAFHRIDISASKKLGQFKLKLTGTNLLNRAVALEQGPVVVQRYQPGVVLGASLEWAP
jgi:hypothetical protein